ncbi:hypothetical protein FHW67_002401 [Herbaspirillum sp. Sphag1AN]|uniref:hypothetical protein n=1 Tax=unclassified Herbaspirillum TaxID=2624150 RepID=UPI00160C2D62|nr:MULTISPECIES: hypothetical protein [unclassified Herbaspirillum]MBB3213112.1 hypothetical protein [Herbaspirillum sp. Sphag1AN]MBB3246309.1 hypothetical protein [Herbaspirillum sp. Sphag64]
MSAPVAQASLEKNETKIVSEEDQKTIDVLNKWWKSLEELKANLRSTTKGITEFQKLKLEANQKVEIEYLPKVRAMVDAYGYETLERLLESNKIVELGLKSLISPGTNSFSERCTNRGTPGFSQRQLNISKAKLKSDPNTSLQSKRLAPHKLPHQRHKQS